jgi:hypothetical protein
MSAEEKAAEFIFDLRFAVRAGCDYARPVRLTRLPKSAYSGKRN